MKLLIVCMITSVVVIGFVLSVMYQEPEKPKTDTEKAEAFRKQLNEWQDNDNNLNE